MKILFTGASGFLGRWAAPRLSQSHEVVGTYDLEGSPLDGVRLVRLDLEDLGACRRLVEIERPDLVIHAAAISRPGPCEEDPAKAERVNVLATRVFAETAKRLIFLSTDLVFDGTLAPYREIDPVSPSLVYSRTKVEGERIVLEECSESLVLRFANGYGWSPVGRPTFCAEIYKKIRSGEGVDLYADQFRTPLYVKDAAEILVRLVDAAPWPADRDRIFHFGGPETISRLQFGRLFCEALKLDDTKIRAVTMASVGITRPADCSLNSSRLYDFTKYRPKTPAEGFADMALEIL